MLYPKTEHGGKSAMEAKRRSLALTAICVGYDDYSALTSVLVLSWLRGTGSLWFKSMTSIPFQHSANSALAFQLNSDNPMLSGWEQSGHGEAHIT